MNKFQNIESESVSKIEVATTGLVPGRKYKIICTHLQSDEIVYSTVIDSDRDYHSFNIDLSKYIKSYGVLNSVLVNTIDIDSNISNMQYITFNVLYDHMSDINISLVSQYVRYGDSITVVIDDPRYNDTTIDILVSSTICSIRLDKSGKGSSSVLSTDICEKSIDSIYVLPIMIHDRKSGSNVRSSTTLYLIPNDIYHLMSCDPNDSILDNCYNNIAGGGGSEAGAGSGTVVDDGMPGSTNYIDEGIIVDNSSPPPIEVPDPGYYISDFDSSVLPNGQIVYAYSALSESNNNSKIFLRSVNSTVGSDASALGSAATSDLGFGIQSYSSMSCIDLTTRPYLPPGILVSSLFYRVRVSNYIYKQFDTFFESAEYINRFDDWSSVKFPYLCLLIDNGSSSVVLGQVIERTDDSVIVAINSTEVELGNNVCCVGMFIYKDKDSECKTDISLADKLVLSENNIDISSQSVNMTRPRVIVSSPYDSNDIKMVTIYVFAEGIINGSPQIFSRSIHGEIICNSGDEGSSAGSMSEWVQLTTVGENRNVEPHIDSYGNIHLTWESLRNNLSCIFYGTFGPSQLYNTSKVLADSTSRLIGSLTQPVSSNVAPYEDYMSNSNYDMVSFDSSENTVTIDNVNKSVNIEGSSLDGQAMAFCSIRDTRHTSNGVSFSLSINNNDVLSEWDIDNLYSSWKQSFSKSFSSGYIQYVGSNNNILNIEKTDPFYDRMIPICGSYINDLAIEMQDGNTSSTFDKFIPRIDIGKNAINHYMVGIMPEKVAFRAKNSQKYESYLHDNNIDPVDGPNYYIHEIENVVYTGYYKLCVIQSDYGKYKIRNEVGNRFSSGSSIEIHSIYNKMFIEDISLSYENSYYNIDTYVNWGIYNDEYNDLVDESRCSLNLFVFQDKLPVYSGYSTVNSLVDYFAIGFGWGSGYNIANTYINSSSSVYDTKQVDLSLTNILLGPSQVETNNYIYSNTSAILSHKEDVFASDSQSYRLSNNTANMIYGPFVQIPISIDNIGLSPDISTDHIGNVGIVYQNNRNGPYNIYYYYAGSDIHENINNSIGNFSDPSIVYSTNGPIVTFTSTLIDKNNICISSKNIDSSCMINTSPSIVVNDSVSTVCQIKFRICKDIYLSPGDKYIVLEMYTDSNYTDMLYRDNNLECKHGTFVINDDSICSMPIGTNDEPCIDVTYISYFEPPVSLYIRAYFTSELSMSAIGVYS